MPHLHLVSGGSGDGVATGTGACLEAAHRFLSSFRMNGCILVAVSGGSDSTGLMLSLQTALRSGRYPGLSLAACTVDHALRPSSAQEARAVAALCQAHGLSHVTMRWDAPKPTTGLQAQARLARYRLLAQAAAETGAICVATGHTRDDQDETIAMRERRADQGAGLSGMAPAMLFEQSLPVLRPFLSVRRADIRAFLTAQGEGWIDDPSNMDSRFERVRVRMESGPNAADDRAARTAAQTRFRSSARAADLLSRHVRVFLPLACRVDPALASLSGHADARLALLSLAATIGGRSHLLGREAADRVTAFLESGRNGRLTAGRVVYDRRVTGLYLYREARGLAPVSLAPRQQFLWDGRFVLTNTSDVTLSVVPMGEDVVVVPEAIAGAVAAGLPEAVAKRAARALFHVESPFAGALHWTVRLAPFDTFLPCFDSIMADMLAALFGRDPYRSLPLHDVFTEKPGWR